MPLPCLHPPRPWRASRPASLCRAFLLATLLCLAPLPALAMDAPLPGSTAPTPHPLTLAARVWGLAKYYHPEVTACSVDWDQALLDRVAALEAAGAGAQREAVLSDLLQAAGDTPRQPPGADTPQWIVQAGLGTALTEQLAWLAAQRPQQQCYVSPAPNTAQALFASDAGHATADPDRAHRALAAFRFWNAVEYFFPYKQDIGRDWAWVLDQTLAAVLDATTTYEYVIAIRALTAATEDSHAFLSHPPIHAQPGSGLPPFEVRLIEGKVVVVQRQQAAGPVQLGDELLTVDGRSVAEEQADIAPLMHGSNPVFTETLSLRNVLHGVPNPGVFRLRRPDGSEYDVSLARVPAPPPGPLDGQPVWQQRTLDGCTMGIIDMGRLEPADVDTALDAVRDADAIVFDVRNYPNGTMWPIVDQLFTEPRDIAHFTRPRFDQPGAWRDDNRPIGGRTPQPYAGRLLVLQDERSISQSEFSVMGLQAVGDTLVFGSQTAAADGNITQINLPGDIRATFTGLGVYYPDGRATQRIGIVPDVHVRPTIAGLVQGRDEVLEAALDCKWLSQDPPQRLPPDGLYFAPARNGEGLDVHHAGDLGAVLSYGYDDNGAPEWLLSAGSVADGSFGKQFHRYAGGPDPVEAAAAHAVDFHAGPYTPACAIADQNALHPRGAWQWPAPEGSYEICVTPLLLSADGEATGLWAGPPQEHGWGVSVHQHAAGISVVVYAYDADDNPRWLLGNAAWSGTGEVEIPLTRMQGFCRSCAPVPITAVAAGTLRLRLDGVHSGDASDNWLSIDADFGDGTRWQRTHMPLFRLLGD